MQAEGISAFRPLEIWPAAAAVSQPARTGKNFQAVLLEGLEQLNWQQVQARQKAQSLLQGEGVGLHEVMLSMEQAGLALEFTVQLRNKLMDAYNEIMHMQV